MGAPSPEGLFSLGCLCSPSRLLSLPLSPLSRVKRIVTHLLCVCLNKIYIVLSFLFSFFFHVSSLILHIEAPWRGPAVPLPSSWLERGALAWAGSWGGRCGHGAGRQATGLRRVAGPAGSGWFFGWSLELCWGHPPPRYLPATSTGRTTSGAHPRILGQGSCLSWAHLPLSTLPLLSPPPPLPSPPGLEEPGGRRSEEARRSNFQAVPLP